MNINHFSLIGGLAIATGLILADSSLAQRRERVGESGTGRVPVGGGRGTGSGAGVGGAAGALIGGRLGSSVPSSAQVRGNVRGEAYGRPTDSYRRGTYGLDRAADRFDREWFNDSPDATERGTGFERAVDQTSRRPQDWIDQKNPAYRPLVREPLLVGPRDDRVVRDVGGLANDPDLIRGNRYRDNDRYYDRNQNRVARRTDDQDVLDRRRHTFDGRDPYIEDEQRDFDRFDRRYDRAGNRIDRNRDGVVEDSDRIDRRPDRTDDRVTRDVDPFTGRDVVEDRSRFDDRDNRGRNVRDRDNGRETRNMRDREDRRSREGDRDTRSSADERDDRRR